MSDAEKRAAKATILAALGEKLSILETGKSSLSHQKWLAKHLNNAYLASVSTYTELVSHFHVLLAEQGGDIERFYDQVRELSQLPKGERVALLRKTDGRSLSASNTGP